MKKCAQKVQVSFIVDIANIRNRDAMHLSAMEEWKNFAERENGTRCREDKTQLFHKKSEQFTNHVYIYMFFLHFPQIV